MIRIKRLSAFAAAAAALLWGLSCSALNKGISCEFTPGSQRGSLFYVDIDSASGLSAAVFEMSFDSGLVEFREASAAQESSDVRVKAENGAVKIAFADSSAVSGSLCRLTFKAVGAGECAFSLHTEQAANGKGELCGDYDDCALYVVLGKGSDGSLSAHSARSASGKAKGLSSTDSGSGEKSEKTSPEGDAQDPRGQRAPEDISGTNPLLYVGIGAGAALLAAALVALGIILGRRMKTGKKAAEEDELPEKSDPPRDSKQAPLSAEEDQNNN